MGTVIGKIEWVESEVGTSVSISFYFIRTTLI